MIKTLCVLVLTMSFSSPVLAEDKRLSKVNLLLNDPNPIALLQKSFLTFRFSSKSTLEEIQQTAGEIENSPESLDEGNTDSIPIEKNFDTKVAESDLLVEGKDRIYLKRKLFTGEFPIHLWVRGRQVYLKNKEVGDPEKVTYQREFARWSERAVKEVLALYENLESTNLNWVAKDSQTECTIVNNGELCLDRDSGVPISGHVKKEITPKLLLSAAFTLLPGLPDGSIAWPDESQEQKVPETP